MKMSKFKPLKSRFRATFGASELAAKRLGVIDAENEVLHDVQITLEGEAKGHGIWLDREFCEAVAEQGNATGDVGVKVRYGHPAMCSDAIGTELGRAKNFRVVDFDRVIDGKTVKCAGVVADIHLLKSAHAAPQGDIAKHVLETAKEDPGQFGQSIVFTYADWVVKDKDGNRHSYREEVEGLDAEGKVIVGEDGKPKDRKSDSEWRAQSADGKEYVVLGKLHGTDFTDTPAATDGIFSTRALAEEAEQMLDEHPQILETLEKNPKSVLEFLERTGLAEKVESARLAGLQAAKDKELAELRTEFDGFKKKSADALAAANAQAKEQIEKLTADLGEKTKALADAKASVEQLTSKNAEISTALSEAKAALEKSETRYREQIGAALKPSADKFAGLSGRDRAIAALTARNNG